MMIFLSYTSSTISRADLPKYYRSKKKDGAARGSCYLAATTLLHVGYLAG